MRTRWMVVAGAMPMIAGCTIGQTVDDAWIRLPAVPGRPAALYATITGGSSDGVLTAITTPAARRVELHRSKAGGHGSMTMQPVAALDVARGNTVRLAPGGLHAMLFDLAPGLAPGGTVTVTFDFDGYRRTAPARLIAAGDPAPE